MGEKKVKIICKNLRKKKFKHFTVCQGACSDGNYIYAAFERKPKKGRKHAIKIGKFDTTGGLVKASKALQIGHANDMTIKDGVLYVTHSGTSQKIHRIDPDKLTKLSDVKINIPSNMKKCNGYNGITTYKDGFLIRGFGDKFYITDSDLHAKKIIHLKSIDNRSSQGMTCNDENIYRGFSGVPGKAQVKHRNEYCVYDMNGKLVKRVDLSLTGEMESIFFVGTVLYSTVHRSYKKKGKSYIHSKLVKIG